MQKNPQRIELMEFEHCLALMHGMCVPKPKTLIHGMQREEESVNYGPR